MRGFLTLPANAKILTIHDENLGQRFILNKDSFLYSKPPTKRLDKLARRATEESKEFIDDNSDQYIVVDNKENQAIGVVCRLNKGQRVMANKLDNRDGFYEVVSYSPVGEKIDGVPESGREIEIKQRGFVLSSYLRKDKTQKESFESTSNQLFPAGDLTSQVKQSIFGDCFLLSAILAILNSKPTGEQFIKSMMKQDGDYTIVRLYHPETGEPIYFKINNSYYHINNWNTVKHTGLWVHILEKAYIALGYISAPKTSENKYQRTYSCFDEIYGKGGKPSTAFKILTGQEVSEVPIYAPYRLPGTDGSIISAVNTYSTLNPLIEFMSEDENDTLDQFLADYFEKDNSNVSLKSLLQKIEQLNHSNIEAEIDNTFSDETKNLLKRICSIDNKAATYLDLLVQYITKYYEYKVLPDNPLGEIFPSIKMITEFGEYLYGQLSKDPELIDKLTNNKDVVWTHKEVTDLIIKIQTSLPELPSHLRECFDARLIPKNDDDFHGTHGTGLYSSRMQDMYNDISSALDRGEVLCSCTLAKFDKHIPGLRSHHAYAIHRVHEEEEDGIKRKFITLYNPWSHTGRKYLDTSHVVEGQVAEETQNPEVEIELCDFDRYFFSYATGRFIAPQQIQHESQQITTKPQKNFFLRHWKSITTFTGTYALGGLLGGLAIGIAFAITGAVPTFGLSIFAIPVFGAMGAVAGGALGTLMGASSGSLGNLIVDSLIKKKPAANTSAPYGQKGSTTNFHRTFRSGQDGKREPNRGPSTSDAPPKIARTASSNSLSSGPSSRTSTNDELASEGEKTSGDEGKGKEIVRDGYASCEEKTTIVKGNTLTIKAI